VKIELSNVQETILREIGDSRLHQFDVAQTYGLILRLRQEKQVDWPTINRAIVARWPKGLARVKEMAWKFAEGRA
jgi:hypothetical protein